MTIDRFILPRLLRPIEAWLRQPKVVRRYEQGMAVLAIINLGFVGFDLSYIPFRDFYLREFPLLVKGLDYIPRSRFIQDPSDYIPVSVDLNFLVEYYDKIPPLWRRRLPLLMQGYDYTKGIKERPETNRYIEAVAELEQEVELNGLNSLTRDRATQAILKELRDRSVALIDDNPFEALGKSRNLEIIKDRILEQFEEGTFEDSREAFREFWSADYLASQSQEEFKEKIQFYRDRLEPLIRSSYRRDIDERTGIFIDRFARFDVFFALIFGIEFLVRTYIIHRTYTGLRWLDGMFWRWFDIFLWLPFARGLRLIPVIIRSDRAGLLTLKAIQKQISQGFVAGIAEDITEIIAVRTLNQVQSLVRQGNLVGMLPGTTAEGAQEYIDLNQINEVAELTRIFADLLFEKVLPEVRPYTEAFLQYNLNKSLDGVAVFQDLKRLPNMSALQAQVVERVVHQLYGAIFDTSQAVVRVALEDDPEADKLLKELSDNLGETLVEKLRSQETLDKIQSLLDALIEEIKINYVERASQENVEDLLEQTRRLRRAAQSGDRRHRA